MPGAYQYMNARTQIDLSAGADLKKILGSKYAPSVNFSVWNLTDAVTEQYVRSPAVFDNHKAGPFVHAVATQLVLIPASRASSHGAAG